MRNVFYNWGPAVVGLTLVLTSQTGCASLQRWGDSGDLPCNDACSPEMKTALDERKLAVDLDYNEVFGKDWVVGIGVPITHWPKEVKK